MTRYAGGGYSEASEEDARRLEEARLDLWWGVSLPEYASKYGYHEVETSDFRDEWVGAGEPYPPGFLDAMNKCIDGWYAIAYEGVGFTQQEMVTLVGEVEVQVKRESRVNALVLEASDRWSDCMAGQGYTYDDPHAALGEFMLAEERSDGTYNAMLWMTPDPTEDELRIAVADAGCKVDTGFWEAVDAAEEEASREVMASMRPQIETLRQANDRLAENVARNFADQ
jgi:hypothetical protein